MQGLSFFGIDRPGKSGLCWRDMTEKKALHFTTSANAQANAATIAASMG